MKDLERYPIVDGFNDDFNWWYELFERIKSSYPDPPGEFIPSHYLKTFESIIFYIIQFLKIFLAANLCKMELSPHG